MMRSIQRIAVTGMLSMVFLLSICLPVLGAEHPILYLFWGDGCPHCEEEKEFLEIVKQDYPQVEMRLFEVWHHPEFAKLAGAMGKAYDVKAGSVPMTFLGEWNHVGFTSFETTGVEMTRQIEQCLQQGCLDALDALGPQKIVLKIREEAAHNTPDGWELHQAASVEEDSSKETTQPAEKS
jgi:thiol-disulfide isomerase/thioredoxin